MCRNEKTPWWSPFSPSTRWVLGIKLRFAKLACQACLPDHLSHHSTDYEFFFKTWWIARSLSKLVRSLILPTLLELILAGLEPILAVPQLSVHSEVEAPCWQGLCCHLPPSVSLSLGYLLPNPLEVLHFFFFWNEWQRKLIPEPWTPKTLQHVSSFVPENILQTFSRFNWGFWEVLLCFFSCKNRRSLPGSLSIPYLSGEFWKYWVMGLMTQHSIFQTVR